MARFDPAVGAGAFSTAMSAVVGVPVIMSIADGHDATEMPGWLWIMTYALLLATQVTATWLSWAFTRRAAIAIYGLCVALGPVVVIGAPRAGWLPIVLIMTAAVGCYLVSMRAVAVVIAINLAAVGVAAAMLAGSAVELAFPVIIYGVIHAGTAMSIAATQRESRMREELAAAHAELRATTAALAETSRTAERLRIARDLHDAVGHQLTSLALELEVASHRPEAAHDHVTRSRRIAGDLLTDVRSVVSELRDQPADLRGALETMVADIPRPRIVVNVDDDVALDERAMLVLLRCAQEAVTNAIRHADANTMRITVTGDVSGTALVASDDGVGAERLVPGNGLSHITERAESLGGHAIFTSSSGFDVTVWIPAS